MLISTDDGVGDGGLRLSLRLRSFPEREVRCGLDRGVGESLSRVRGAGW